MLNKWCSMGIKSSALLAKGNAVKFSFCELNYNLIFNTNYYLEHRGFSTTANSNLKSLKISWKDLKNLVDLPENRDKGLKHRVIGIKDQIVKLGGVRVVVFYFGSMFAIWGCCYGIMRYSLLDMDTLIDLMSRFEVTSRGITLVEQYPNWSYLILSYLTTNCFDPLRTLFTLFYARHVLRKNYLRVSLENIQDENESVKRAVASVTHTDLTEEEKKNDKLKTSRIITIKKDHNSSMNI